MKKIGLDAGHGLYTAGKQTPDGIKEWTLDDKVRDKVVTYLKDYEVEIIHCDNNEGVKDESLTARRTMYVNANVDAATSIHHNAFKGKWGKHTGVGVYVDKKCTKADMRLAELIYKRLVEYTGLKGRGIKKENFTVINQNKVPTVLIEGGFMDSTIDYPVITSDKGQDAYARAVAEGLIEFLDLKKKKPVVNPSNAHKERVKSWQLVMNKVYKCKLVVDSNFGPDCEAKANKYYLYKKSLAVLRFKNDYVKWLQNRLKELGYNITVDGSFWKDTDKAVRQFQKDRGLVADGKVGANTVRELLK
jgi:N-acetylmuramoyl-L-alanine amidase